MNIEIIFEEVKKSFPEIKAKLKSFNSQSFMASRPFGNYIFYDKRQLNKYKFSKLALRGILAHELAHKIQAKKAGFIEKIMVFTHQKFRLFDNPNKKRELEREADTIAVKMGFGKELIQAIKESKDNFDKERFIKFKKTRLSIKEIKELMGK